MGRNHEWEMIPIHSASNAASRVIAYLAPGVKISVTDDKGEWSRDPLVWGGSGYVLTRNLFSVLPEKDRG